jgi:hypothetical protein
MLSFLPKPCISRYSFNVRTGEEASVTVVDGIVCPFGSSDQEFRIKYPLFAIFDVTRCQWIEVVNKKLSSDLVTWNAQITPVIPRNYVRTSLTPLMRLVESLVNPPIESESLFTDVTMKNQVVKALIKGFKP